MITLPLGITALAFAHLQSASDHPPIFPGRFYSTDLEAKGTYSPADVAAADMDQDGHLDALILRGAPKTAVSLLRGDGRGSLRCTSTLEAPPSETGSGGEIAVLDVDGDGHLDAVASGAISGGIGELHVFHGNGAGALASHSIVNVSSAAGRIEAVDMNGDGLLDLVLLVQGGLSILMRQPAGGFASETTYPSPNASLGLGDVDFDLDQDVVTANVDGEVWLFLNAGDGTLLPHQKLHDTSSTHGLELADLDGDGRLDLVRGRKINGRTTLCVHLGDGGGQFGPPLEQPIGYGDLIGAGQLQSSRVVALVRNSSLLASVALESGHLTEPQGLLSAYFSYVFVLADLDEDGTSDWIKGTFQEDLRAAVSVLPGAGDGTLRGVLVSPTPYAWPLTHLVDFNNDGILDSVGADWVQPFVSVNLGRAGGRFLPASVHRAGGYYPRPLPGDFDGDGNLDLAVLSQSPPSISLSLGNGSGGFGPSETLYTLLPWYTPSGGLPIASDVDHDGSDEAIVAAPLNGSLEVFGAADGRFRLESSHVTTGVIGPVLARIGTGTTAPDIVYLRRGPVESCELWGLALDSNGAWQPAFSCKRLPIPWMPGVGSVPWKEFMHLCDLDGDDELDVIAHRAIEQPGWLGYPTTVGTQIGIWRGGRGESWVLCEATRFDGGVSRSTLLDLDGDGAVELVMSQWMDSMSGHGGALVVRRLDQGKFVGEPDRYPFGLPLADVNGDDHPDVVWSATGGVVTFLNQTSSSR
jgi:FG-GAP-like repeat